MALPSSARTGVRAATALVYGSASALAVALVARPALLWLGTLGLRGPVLPAEVPLGGAFCAAAAALCVLTLHLAISSAGARRRQRVPGHAALLVLVACAVGLRGAAGAPVAARDPGPALRAALVSVAGAVDGSYTAGGTYAPDVHLLEEAVQPLPAPGFVLRGRPLPLSVRLLEGAAGPQLDPLPGDLPGTVYCAVASDRTRAFLSVLTLRGDRVDALREGGAALVLQARGGTHGEPGEDPLLPAYPARLGRGPGAEP